MNDNQEILASSERITGTRKGRIMYQPLKLNKTMGERFEGNNRMMGLDIATGFHLIQPDQEYNGLLSNLQYNPEQADRRCEIAMVVAMYNEGVEEFQNTILGIASNLQTLQSRGVPSSSVAIIVITDGYRAFFEMLNKNINAKQYFSNFFDEEMIKDRFQVQSLNDIKLENQTQHDQIAHVFMTTQVFAQYGGVQMQMFFTIKQKNLRKLNTHLWFFGGFCDFMNPNFVILLDVGTRPLKKSLFYLYEAMRVDPNLAGCCGQIKPMAYNIFNPVVSAQAVEYKFAHIFDKALESVLGYITVLPGAFSAYRWEALQGKPLWEQYFKSICHPEEMDCFHCNIYLAQDRVLCLALVSKEGHRYHLRYVRKSVAQTDVPEHVDILMYQRRRWINGSWFALIRSLKDFKDYYHSDHTCCEKFVFTLQMAYYWITIVFTWFMVASFFLVFAITARKFFDNTEQFDHDNPGDYFIYFYILLLFLIFILSLAVKPDRVRQIYYGAVAIFSVYMLFAFVLMISFIVENDFQSDWAIYVILATISLFVFNILANCTGVYVLKGVIQMTALTPTYVNIFIIYSICNTQDCTWGNRPGQMTDSQKQRQQDFKAFRAKWCIVWAMSNVAFAYVINSLEQSNQEQVWYIYVIALIGGGILALRTLFGVIYIIVESCKKRIPKDRVKPKGPKGSKSQDGPIVDAEELVSEEVLVDQAGIQILIKKPVQQQVDEVAEQEEEIYQDDSEQYEDEEAGEEFEEEESESPEKIKNVLIYIMTEKSLNLDQIGSITNIETRRLRAFLKQKEEPVQKEWERIVRLIDD